MKNRLRSLWIVLGAVLFLSLHLLIPAPIPAQAPELTGQLQTLAQADRLYLKGDTAAAEKLYRKVKPAFANERSRVFAQPISNPEELSPDEQTLWKTAQAGSDSQTLEPLKLLLAKRPEFIPAQLLYAEAVRKHQSKEEAIPILEQAASQFPDSVDLTKALIKILQDDKQWLNASIAARQFAMVYPNHAETPVFTKAAEENFDRFRRGLKRKGIFQGILGGVVGVFTGDQGKRAVEVASLMIQGESNMGQNLAAAISQQLPLINDSTISEYINKVGNDIANLMGRNDFKYEFYVVDKDVINAFALPGGKVFVNKGVMLLADSEAELAGLLGHEVAHAVLSHAFERITKASLFGSIGEALPFGKIVAGLVTLNYSRQNERQSDVVGTRVLSTAGYAADGLRNLFVKMQQNERGNPPEYLSSHPATENRIRELENLIQRNGYNRYAFEGVEKYAAIKERLRQL